MAEFNTDRPYVSDFPGHEAKIGIRQAVSIARKFLEQCHSPVIFKSSRLDNNSWLITMEVGLLKEDIINVAVDSDSGMILGYTFDHGEAEQFVTDS
ncbi:MAG: hypothetical protein ACREBI_10980 [Nitrosotalea sp.]